MLLAQLSAWVKGDIARVQSIGDAVVSAFPRDLASVKLHQYFSFNRGDAPAMLAIAEKARAASPDNPHLLGMLAFAHEQLHDLDSAHGSPQEIKEGV